MVANVKSIFDLCQAVRAFLQLSKNLKNRKYHRLKEKSWFTIDVMLSNVKYNGHALLLKSRNSDIRHRIIL